MMSSDQKQELRHAVRGYLYDRSQTQHRAKSITRALQNEHLCTEADVIAALQFLAGLDPVQVTSQPDDLGSMVYHKITSSGILAHERIPGL